MLEYAHKLIMKLNSSKNLKDKELVVFDLDGTLAPTKSTIDHAMNNLLKKLLIQKEVAVIGGGKLELFKHQLFCCVSA